MNRDYLGRRQIANHCFAFQERLIVINNVEDRKAVFEAAQQRVAEGILTGVVVAEESMLASFGLKREDFRGDPVSGSSADWLYYNALAPLAALHAAKSDYILYLTGDVRLEEPFAWIEQAIRLMEKNPFYKVANPLWNDKIQEAKKESIRKKRNFFVSDRGFSDQLFLARRADFCQPIYQEIREDASHYPRGDIFEKRVFSAMRNRGWLRLTYSKGSYIHENF